MLRMALLTSVFSAFLFHVFIYRFIYVYIYIHIRFLYSFLHIDIGTRAYAGHRNEQLPVLLHSGLRLPVLPV